MEAEVTGMDRYEAVISGACIGMGRNLAFKSRKPSAQAEECNAKTRDPFCS
jgi:hypothetical protein